MISSDGIRGYNDAIILTLLAEGDSYGYEISKEIKSRTDEGYVIKETTLYSAFTRLGKQGFIEAYPGEVTHGKKRTYYRITAAGRDYLQEKREEWQLTKQVVDRFLAAAPQPTGDATNGNVVNTMSEEMKEDFLPPAEELG